MSDGRSGTRSEDATSLPDRIVVDAHGDDEQLWALRQAFEDGFRYRPRAWWQVCRCQWWRSTTTGTAGAG